MIDLDRTMFFKARFEIERLKARMSCGLSF